MDRKCVQCGKAFTLSQSEMDFFHSRALSLPKRCKTCRQRNKSSGISKNNPALWRYSDKHPYSSYYVRNTNTSAIAISFIIMVITAFFAICSLIQFWGFAYILLSSVSFLFSSVIFVAAATSSKVLIQEFDTKEYRHNFYDTKSMTEHYVKHGKETNSISMEDYLAKANNVISDSSCRTKTIQNGDKLYYKPRTNEFVVIAKAGYIRTYFIASSRYYYQQ